MRWVPLLWLVACGGQKDKVLADLDGAWTGTIDAIGGPFTLGGEMNFDEERSLLSGVMTVGDPVAPRSYAIRRSEVLRDLIYLELTDVDDGTRGLDLDGTVDGAFSGEVALRYPCELGTCGYEGTFKVTRGPGGGTTATGDTGR